MYEERDLEGILRLWEESSGWGGITEEQFRQWYLNTPYGPCLVVVATDESDKVVGQLVFTPSRLHINNREIKALRAAAPILDKNQHYGKLTHRDHPFYALFGKGVEMARQQGYRAIYLFPAVGWTTVLKLFPKYGLPEMPPSSYPCFAVSLRDASTYSARESDVSVKLLQTGFTPEYDQLWREATSQFPIACGVVRNARWLNWKLGTHTVFEVRHKNTEKLSGYVAIKKDSGLIVDMLAKTEEDLLTNLERVVQAIHHLNPERISLALTELKGMYSPLVQRLLPDAGTLPFTFVFGCCSLHSTIGDEQIQPANWYMMPND